MRYAIVLRRQAFSSAKVLFFLHVPVTAASVRAQSRHAHTLAMKASSPAEETLWNRTAAVYPTNGYHLRNSSNSSKNSFSASVVEDVLADYSPPVASEAVAAVVEAAPVSVVQDRLAQNRQGWEEKQRSRERSSGSSAPATSGGLWGLEQVADALSRVTARTHSSPALAGGCVDTSLWTEQQHAELNDVLGALLLAGRRKEYSQWMVPACHLAYQCGQSLRCCQLYFTCVAAEEDMVDMRETFAALGTHSVGSSSGGTSVQLPEYVIQSAGATQDPQTLRTCLILAEHANARERAVASASSSLDVDDEAVQGATWRAGPAVVRGLHVFWQCVANTVAGRHFPSNKVVGDTLREERLSEFHSVAQRAALGLLGLSSAEFETAFATSVRLAVYAAPSPAVSAQCAVLMHVFRLWAQRCLERTASLVSGSSEPHSGVLTWHWLSAPCLSLLLRTAITARRWDYAEYVSLFLDLYLDAKASAGISTAEHAGEAVLERRGESTLVRMPEQGLSHHEDTMVALFIRYCHFTRQNTRALQWLRHVCQRFPAYTAGFSTITAAAAIAGDEHDAVLITWCLEQLLNDAQADTPSLQDVFFCVCAGARCGLATLEPLVDSLVETGLLQLNAESALYVQLLSCRRSPYWRENLEELLASYVESEEGFAKTNAPKQQKEALSSRCMLLVLLLMQEGEHARFMTYYRLFLAHWGYSFSRDERARCAIYAVVWCTSKASTLAEEDAVYVAREVAQLLCPSSSHIPPSFACSSITSESNLLCSVATGAFNERGQGDMTESTRSSLATKWETLRAQFPQAWWRRHVKRSLTLAATAGAGRKKSLRTSRVTARRTDQDVMDALECALTMNSARSRVASPSPIFRFLKKRNLLQLSQSPISLLEGVTYSMPPVEDMSWRDGVAEEDGYAYMEKRIVWQQYISS